MNNVNSFKEIFKSITDYRKIIVIIFSIQTDKNLIKK